MQPLVSTPQVPLAENARPETEINLRTNAFAPPRIWWVPLRQANGPSQPNPACGDDMIRNVCVLLRMSLRPGVATKSLTDNGNVCATGSIQGLR